MARRRVRLFSLSKSPLILLEKDKNSQASRRKGRATFIRLEIGQQLSGPFSPSRQGFTETDVTEYCWQTQGTFSSLLEFSLSSSNDVPTDSKTFCMSLGNSKFLIRWSSPRRNLVQTCESHDFLVVQPWRFVSLLTPWFETFSPRRNDLVSQPLATSNPHLSSSWTTSIQKRST